MFLFLLFTISIFILASLMDGWRLNFPFLWCFSLSKLSPALSLFLLFLFVINNIYFHFGFFDGWLALTNCAQLSGGFSGPAKLIHCHLTLWYKYTFYKHANTNLIQIQIHEYDTNTALRGILWSSPTHTLSLDIMIQMHILQIHKYKPAPNTRYYTNTHVTQIQVCKYIINPNL